MAQDKRYALVTGGSGELGRAAALRLARAGMGVCLQYRSNAGKAEEGVASILSAGGEAFAVRADLADSSQASGAVAEAAEKWGRLDVLVNAAGGNRDVMTMFMSDEDFDSVIASNLRSAFLASRAALKPMIRNRWGRIINVASVSAWAAVPGQANYAAAKAGLIGFTRSLAAEVARLGITVNAVAPGAIESEAIGSLPQERRRKILEGIPMARLGTPGEVAAAVEFLASDSASYITGQVLAVSGGLG